MEDKEVRIECIRLAIDYARYTEAHASRLHTDKDIVDTADKFYNFIHNEQD